MAGALAQLGRRARAGRLQRGRARRGLLERADAGRRGQRRRAALLRARPRATSASSPTAAERSAGRHARGERRASPARSSTAGAAGAARRARRWRAINAGAAIYAAGAAETIAEGVEAAREAIADGRAPAALEGYVAASQPPRAAGGRRDERRARGRVLERILAETREERRAPQARAAARASTPARTPPARRARFRDALARTGDRRDRRVQAPLALGRHRCATRRISSEIVGAYERGGAVAASILTEGPNFGGSLEDLRARARGLRAAAAAQGLRRRPLPAARGARGGRGRGAADRRRARRRRSSRALHEQRRRARARRAGRGARRGGAGARAASSARRSSASTTATCATSASTSSAPSALMAAMPGGGDRRLGVGHRRSRAARARCEERGSATPCSSARR